MKKKYASGEHKEIDAALKEDKAPALSLILCADHIRSSRVTEALVEKHFSSGVALNKISAESLNQAAIRRLEDETRATSLFASSNCFLIEGVENLKGDNLKLLTELIKNALSGTFFILTGKKLAKNTALYKHCSKNGLTAELENLSTPTGRWKDEQNRIIKLNKWVERELKLQGIEKPARTLAALFRELGNSSPDNIVPFIATFSIYLDGAPATETAFSEIFDEAVNPDNFALSNALEQKNRPKAEQIASHWLSKNHKKYALLMLLPPILRSQQQLLLIRKMVDDKIVHSEIARKTGLKEYPLKLKLEAVRKFSQQKLSDNIRAILLADCRIKDRSLNATGILTSLIYNMTE